MLVQRILGYWVSDGGIGRAGIPHATRAKAKYSIPGKQSAAVRTRARTRTRACIHANWIRTCKIVGQRIWSRVGAAALINTRPRRRPEAKPEASEPGVSLATSAMYRRFVSRFRIACRGKSPAIFFPPLFSLFLFSLFFFLLFFSFASVFALNAVSRDRRDRIGERIARHAG